MTAASGPEWSWITRQRGEEKQIGSGEKKHKRQGERKEKKDTPVDRQKKKDTERKRLRNGSSEKQYRCEYAQRTNTTRTLELQYITHF